MSSVKRVLYLRVSSVFCAFFLCNGLVGCGGVATQTTSGDIFYATRAFTGQSDEIPDDYAAFGVVAFRSPAQGQNYSSIEEVRQRNICQGYAVIPPTSDVDVPHWRQMVTVWPVITDKLATDLNSKSSGASQSEIADVCNDAVENYNFPMSERAIANAKRAGKDFGTARGPFVLA